MQLTLTPLVDIMAPLCLHYGYLGTYNGPKRNWKQCLGKSLEGQTKSIMVFLILANSTTTEKNKIEHDVKWFRKITNLHPEIVI